MEMVAMAGQVLAEAVGGRAVTKKAASTRANSIKMESVLTEFALSRCARRSTVLNSSTMLGSMSGLVPLAVNERLSKSSWFACP